MSIELAPRRIRTRRGGCAVGDFSDTSLSRWVYASGAYFTTQKAPNLGVRLLRRAAS